MTLTPTPHSEPVRQIDADAARRSADLAAYLADTLTIQAAESDAYRTALLEQAEKAWNIANRANEYASRIEADDFLGGAK
ncbi:hypothetical protein [Rhodococcus artemisiae]|uniref:Antitoxin CcdA n=1 Tax=Rhodococcus artemisiae TaxID=714159 RepID=A0ABU7LBM0_9NOCA|nr:hypothetical protein [Rhodococcus artemisiae]MEE2058940.1 hypothetical protein [Rhodococcus artemisiae]